MSTHDKKRERERTRNAEASKSGRDIGPLPGVADLPRKHLCLDHLRLFCEVYFPKRFDLKWGTDQLSFIADLQRIILEGGQQAESLPRGSGKTTLCEVGALWAVAYGHRSFVVMIGATQGKAEDLLDNVRAEIETNDLLIEDFPELCYPVVKLEGINNRAPGQLLDGERTRIEWTGKLCVFPTVAGSPASGAAIAAEGLTGSIRGMSRMKEGAKVRPDLVIIDDPQTDDSARSPIQNQTRESIISGAVLGLAGPGKKIAAIMPCTPIRPGDMVDRVLDRGKHPDWHGCRCHLLNSMPIRLDLWEEYGELLREGLRLDPPDRSDANEFYRRQRVEMDRGGEASWEARFNEDQLSAIQFGMDLFLLKPATFYAEYQCDPEANAGDANGAEPIDAEQAAQKLNRVARGEVPAESTRLTCGIDIQQEILFWTVVAWDERFGGAVVDYGAWPRQTLLQFSASDPAPSLSAVFPGLSLEARIYAGLEGLAGDVLAKAWKRADGGAPMRVERCLIDTGYLADTVHQWCRQTPLGGVVTPAKGMYVGAKKTAFSEWKPQRGERHGAGWRLKAAPNARGRLALLDVNHWKSFMAERLRSPAGTYGTLYLFGTNPATHRTFTDHLAAEHPIRTNVNGRTVDEWQSNSGRPDNHWFDCLVYATAAAAIAGLKWSSNSAPAAPAKPAKPLRASELYARAQDAREAAQPANAPAAKSTRSISEMYAAARTRERNR